MEFSSEWRWPAGGDQLAQGTGGEDGEQANLSPSRSGMGKRGWVVVESRPERSQGALAETFGWQYTFPSK